MPNGNIRRYIVSYQPASGSNQVMTETVDSEVNMTELTGLMIFTTYNVSVQAETVELGDPSEVVSVTTDEASKSQL